MASIFRLKADVYFEADDLDDALGKLIDHFSHIMDDTGEFPAIEFLANSELELYGLPAWETPPLVAETTTTTTSNEGSCK